MCTMMFYPETLPAEKRSVEDSRRAVDRLMEYDRKLAEDLTVEELRKLFLPDDSWRRPAPENYFALTDAEKLVAAALGFTPPEVSPDAVAELDERDVADLRRRMKSDVIEKPVLDEGGFGAFSVGIWNFYGGGQIYVWLDNMRFGNSKKTGFYYVRDQLSMLWGGTTAYAHPLLIVQKKKLRPDQIEYMERKCRETREAAERAARAAAEL